MNPIEQQLKEKYPNIRFELIPNEKYNRIYLTGFMVPFSLRNTGIGTSFMEDLTKLADQYGYQITLTPDDSYGGNVNRLKDFYQRFGFVFNKGKYNKDFTHKELMHRNPNNLQEEEEATSSGGGWQSGVQRGKANPISNKGTYDFGTARGKANPISNTGAYDFGTTRGKGNPIFEENTSGKTLMCVDIQPEYYEYVNFNIQDWVDMVNEHNGVIVFLYNGYDTLGMIKENDYISWLYELGMSDEVIDSAIFYDKGYAFFRYCIDNDIDDDEIVGLVKMMIEYDINDSRDLDNEFWSEFIERYGNENVKELLEFSDDCINIPDLMDFLGRFSNILLLGGSKNECLKEVEIALMALDKSYERLNSFIYENETQLKEEITRIKNLIKILN